MIDRSGSEQLRLQMSKQLIEECNQSRDDQIKFSKHQQQSLIEAENSEIKEARRYLMEEVNSFSLKHTNIDKSFSFNIFLHCRLKEKPKLPEC